MRAALSATSFASLGHLLSSHRAITRVSLATLSFILIAAVSHQPPAQAGPETAPVVPESLLPQSVGIAVDTTAAITIPFESPMDPASVEAALQLLPEQSAQLTWNADRTVLTLAPSRLWRSDEQYLVVVGAASTTAEGETLGAPQRYAFTTATAPAVSDFQVRLAATDLQPAASTDDIHLTLRSAAVAADADPLVGRVASPEPPDDGSITRSPSRIAEQVSATSSISIDFSAEMDRSDVEDRFRIAPEIDGDLTWQAGHLVFTPSERLEPGTRYTISVIGSHDVHGNVLGGKGNFSFVVQTGAELTKAEPGRNDADVEAGTVTMWFSQPMDREATNKAFSLTDADGVKVKGKLKWNDASTQVTFTPSAALPAGITFTASLGKGGRDADGNVVKATWSFSTTAPPPAPVPAPAAPPPPAPRTTVTTRSAPSVQPPGPSTSLAGHALNQVNAARAAYGFAPLTLDSAISAVAASHAMDQAQNGYFSHYGQNGSTRQQRLAAGGVSFGYSGENQCYHEGMSQLSTLNWCHAQFMAEPYPGHWNHIANILDPRFKRMGVGIATVGGRTVITWNFTD